jgi:hypothetical protein
LPIRGPFAIGLGSLHPQLGRDVELLGEELVDFGAGMLRAVGFQLEDESHHLGSFNALLRPRDG